MLAAAERIGTRVRTTPVLAIDRGPLGIDASVVLKLELMQHTGSFKPRGMFNRMLSAEIPSAGVIAASGGNAGLAVAYAARELGVPAEIFVPATAPQVKVRRLRGYGAKVTETGDHYADALEASKLRVQQTGALSVHAYDDPFVAAGQGTLALELERQAGAFDTALVAVGGGGLIGGIAAWLEGTANVIAVEPERCPTLATALDIGRPAEVEVGGVASDSLGARKVSSLTFEIAIRTRMRSVLVTDKAIMAARQLLWDEFRVATETGGAAAFAALVSGTYRPAPGERVAVVVCGGNTDPSDLTDSTR